MEDRKWHSVEVGFEHEGVGFLCFEDEIESRSTFLVPTGGCNERETQESSIDSLDSWARDLRPL